MFRFGYLSSNKGRGLQAIINACNVLNLPFEIAVVIGDRENEAVERARKANITATVLDYKSFAHRQEFDDAILKELELAGTNGVMLNFDRLLGPKLVSHYHDRIINLHYALLPLFPGFGAIDKAAESGMRFSGITLHMVDDTMDGGTIIAQAIVPMEPDIEKEILGKRLWRISVPMQLQVMSWLAEERLVRNSKGVLEIRNGSYASDIFMPNLESPFNKLPESIFTY